MNSGTDVILDEVTGGNGEDTTFWLQISARFPLLFGVEELKYLLQTSARFPSHNNVEALKYLLTPETLPSTEYTAEDSHDFLVVVMHRRRVNIII